MGIVHGVPQDSVAIVERFGKFECMAQPGFLFRPVPLVWYVAGHISTRVQGIHVKVETKTKDNVFVTVVVVVNVKVIEDDESLYKAFYKLTDPKHQIQSYVEDVVRASMPTLELDNVYFEKQKIAEHIFEALGEQMRDYGYQIISALVVDIDPAADVKRSMNSINAEKRMRIAMNEQAEGEKLWVIKKAEAEAEAAFLQGEGLARQRKAIVEGMRDSITRFESVGGGAKIDTEEVVNLLMITQYFDTLGDMGNNKNADVVMLPKRGYNRKRKAALSPTASTIRNRVSLLQPRVGANLGDERTGSNRSLLGA